MKAGGLHSGEFERYQGEVQAKWGETDAYRQYEERTKDYSGEKWDTLAGEMDRIMGAFAACMQTGESPASMEAQHLVKLLQDHITAHYYTCTKEILAGLGEMYVADQRFKNNIDKHAPGTAEFIRVAIIAFSAQ